jgi:hypothetical protein
VEKCRSRYEPAVSREREAHSVPQSSPPATKNATLIRVIRILLLLLVPMLVAACSGDEPEAEAPPSPAVTALATPRPGATVEPGATVAPPASSAVLNPRLQLKGAFRTPELTTVAASLQLPERPETKFAAWDGASVVIFDTETGESHNFGPGSLALPAFGGGYFVYTSADYEVFLVDLATMEKRFLVRGLLAYFLGDNYLVINPGDNDYYGLDVTTGNRIDLGAIEDPLLKSMASQRWGGAFHGEWFGDRYAIRLVENPGTVCELSGVEQRICLSDVTSQWIVEDLVSGEVLLALEANKVEPAGPNHIVIATTPVCREANWITDCPAVLSKLEAQNANPDTQPSVEGTTNIFLVDMTTGDATFVATATYNAVTGRWPMNWPLAADENRVVWTESYCGNPRGLTRVFDRATGQISELNAGEWLVLSNGRLGFGELGGTAVIDPVTLGYVAVLPELSGVSWSPSLRYAAVGQGFSRGGVCE